MSDRERMPLSELRRTPEFLQLTKKQQLWVSTYVQGGIDTGVYNAEMATRAAYDCKDEESARCLSYTLKNNLNVIEALNRHFNTDPTQDFLKMLDRAIHNKNLTMAQVQAMKMKWDLLGLGRQPKGLAALEREAEKNENAKAKKLAKAPTVVPWNPSDK